MDARSVKTVEDARKIVEERGLKHVKVGVFDIDGILRGKYMAKEKFFSSLEKGFGFCDVVLGWDSNDQLYDNVKVTGWHTGYPDGMIEIDPSTCREIPGEDCLLFIGSFVGKHGEVGPRATLQRMIAKAEKMGFKANAALEFEFFMFDETPHSVREKGYQNLKPVAPGTYGYSMLRLSGQRDLYEAILNTSEVMDFPLEGLHEETGPGVFEGAIIVDDALSAGDKAALFKTYTKITAQQHKTMACFMAKWSNDWPGQSGHLHISLTDLLGNSAFYDPEDENGMTKTMKHFVAGCQKMLPEVLCMVAPTINSFSRLIPGAWAPTDATWGVDNRTCALRVIPGSASSQRVEYRICAADVNPYIALSAVLASGLYGIEHELELSDPVVGNAYTQEIPEALKLPATLWEAAQALKKSAAAREVLGDAFVEHFAASREWEEREFRKAITDWELRRYFEII